MASRLSGPERKQSILTAAQQLFADKGLHGVSIDDIAQAVNVSPAVLYRHFESKQVLYDQVLVDMSCTRESYVDTIVSTGTTFEDVLQGMTKTYIQSVVSNPDVLKIEMRSMLESSPANQSSSQAFFNSRWKSFTDFIEYSLNERLPADAPNRDLTMATAGLMFQGMLRELLLSKCLNSHTHLNQYTIEQLTQELLTLFFRAVGITKSRLTRKAVIKVG